MPPILTPRNSGLVDGIDTRSRFRSLSVFSVILFALAVFGLAFTPLRGSQDEWWHLKTGQWIWQHGQLPLNDIFTYTGANMRWYNHEWLSQLAFYAMYHLGELLHFQGISSVIFGKSIIVAIAFLLVAGLARQRGVSWPMACFIALVAADISRRTIFARPPIFSYVLMAIFLLMLHGWKLGWIRLRWLWLLVPLTVLWANMHGMVLLAIVLTGAYAAGQALDNFWAHRRDHGPEKLPAWDVVLDTRFWTLSALTLAVTLACMAQPSGWHLFFLGRNFTADPLLQNIILEMMPTPRPMFIADPALPLSLENVICRPPGFWTFWVALAGLIMLALHSRMRLACGADYLLVIFFTWQAIAHWRLLPLFAIAVAAPVASLKFAAIQSLNERWRALEAPIGMLALGGAILWFNFTVNETGTFFDRNREMTQGEVINHYDYPAPLLDYLDQAHLPGEMLSDSNYCGYFIWRLSPEKHRLFTDARFDLFGSRFLHLERNIFFAARPNDSIQVGNTLEEFDESWNSLLDKFKINFIVFRPVDRPALHEALTKTDRWRLIYYFIPQGADRSQWPYNGNYVWVRNNDEAAAHAKRAEAYFRHQFPGEIPPSKIAEMISLKHAAATDKSNSTGVNWRQ